jgi:hypothetical protein
LISTCLTLYSFAAAELAMESARPGLASAEGQRQSASFFPLIASFLFAEREVQLGNILEVVLVSVWLVPFTPNRVKRQSPRQDEGGRCPSQAACAWGAPRGMKIGKRYGDASPTNRPPLRQLFSFH